MIKRLATYLFLKLFIRDLTKYEQWHRSLVPEASNYQMRWVLRELQKKGMLGVFPSDPPLTISTQIAASVMDGNVYIRPRLGGETALLPTEAVQFALWLLDAAIEASEASERERKKSKDQPSEEAPE